MNDPAERLRALEALARQLWFGLAAYRLYPESPDRAGFVATAGLIADTARAALATGPVDLEVTGEGLSVGGVPLRADGPVARLARVCFERRIERLIVVEAPSPLDLDAIYRVLNTPVEQLDRLDGPSSMLSAVRTIGFGRLGPIGTMPGGRPAEAADGELPFDALSGTTEERVDALLERLRGAIVEDGDAADTDRVLSDRLVDLPPDLRNAVLGKLVGDAPSDPMAERLIRSMTNAELTRALVDLGGDGGDAVALAERLADAGVRLPDIVDLTTALEAGHEDASTIIAGLEQIGTPVEELKAGSVAEALGNYLVATATEDVRSMQWLAEAEREQSASVGIASLQDYLALERDRHQFDQVAEVWVESMREALRDRADRRVRELLTAVEGIKVPGDDRAFSSVFVPATLRADVIVTLMADPEKEGAASAVQMLEPFGEWGIEALFDQLAEENDRGRRAALLGVIRSLVPGRIGAVAARLGDHRWYVVRNAVNVLRHTGDPQVLDLLAGAAQHESDPVRREAVWGLVSGGPAALPHLVAAASSSDGSVRRMTVEALGSMPVAEAADALAGIVVSGRDLGTRRLALERLATNRAPEAADQLQALVAKRRPKLPRSLRRRARVLAKEGSS